MSLIKTEPAWWTTPSPLTLLSVLKGRRVPRQRRQIAIAACRRVYADMVDLESRMAVEIGERYLDDRATTIELEVAFTVAQHVAQEYIERARRSTRDQRTQAWNIWRLAYAGQLCAARTGCEEVVSVLMRRNRDLPPVEYDHEQTALRAIIHDVVGNPFQPVPTISPAWLAWQGGLLPRLAHELVTESRFGDLPILADALEDAGCAEPDVLQHLRAGGPHVRGCWVLEWLLHRR
ncbi:MAG: hypothetical protein U0840_01570 [Gemmataceae bacterium]